MTLPRDRKRVEQLGRGRNEEKDETIQWNMRFGTTKILRSTQSGDIILCRESEGVVARAGTFIPFLCDGAGGGE